MTVVAARLRRTASEIIRRLCLVPELLTVTEWADKYRVLPETSTSPGPYNSKITPYATRWQNLLADPTVSLVAMCWASQTTKSTVLENGLAYRICRTPAPIVVVQPKIDAAEGWAKERFRPMVRSTAALASRVRLGRASDATMRYLPFPGGFLFVASAQSATELASRSSTFVLCDEVDRYETIPGEGNPVEIVAKRQGAADIGLLALTSTPRDEETTIIWPYLEGGTFELYHVRCPYCLELQPLVWKNARGEYGLRWDKGHPETAHYVCGIGLPDRDDGTRGGCGTVIEETHKRWMLAAENGADWIATNPEAPYPSSHLNGLYSPFAKSGWASLAAEFERAQGKPADLQVFVNTRLAELWKETADVVEGNALLSRLEPHDEGVVPDGVGVLTVGADVQANRIEVYVWGWGAALQSWLVASKQIFGDPEREPDQPGSVWAALDEYLLTQFPHVAGGVVPITCSLVDSGFATSQVYHFTKRRKGRGIFASKGIGGQGIPILGKATLQTKERVVLYPVGVDSVKTTFLRSELMESEHGPGFVHLPDWMTSDQVDQLVAEKRVRKLTRKGVIYEWRKKSPDLPNEALDCRVYARAALEVLGSKTIAQLGMMAEELTAAGLKAAATKPGSNASGSPSIYTPPKPPRGGRGWIGGWK
jgi:phage terminase large subunit GpA-like protein